MRLTNKQLMRALRDWLEAQYELCSPVMGEGILAEVEKRLTRMHDKKA